MEDVIAQRLCKTYSVTPNLDDHTPTDQRLWRNDADNVLRALAEAGYEVVRAGEVERLEDVIQEQHERQMPLERAFQQGYAACTRDVVAAVRARDGLRSFPNGETYYAVLTGIELIDLLERGEHKGAAGEEQRDG